MEETLQTIDIKAFKSLFPMEYDAELGDDFFIADIKYDKALRMLQYPTRFDGFLGIFCVHGHLDMDINLNTYSVSENSLLFSVPGYIIRVSDVGPDELKNLRFIVIAVSRSFMTSMRMDFTRLFNESMSVLSHSCIKLEEEELAICANYMSLAVDILKGSRPYHKESISSLIASVCYFLGGVWADKLSKARRDQGEVISARAKLVFDHFLQLVTDYHVSERNVKFYADKLCLTPKYLSKLVKSVSGRSAPEWIDSFVILEAKNLLRYSEISIKEIVYKLHFPNQSVFYKFFKSHTGLTPSEYRNH
ncbi:MAG: AraC family transcriptional regulator [Bacteroidales bacterium]|nr:AraC family transcriptional regulator [Bacteroidales bacterium]